MFEIFKDLGSNVMPIFGMLFAAFVIFLSYKEKQEKSKEKIAMIEKGLDPSLLDSRMKKQQSRNQLNIFKIGLLLIGIAVGLLLGYLLNTMLHVQGFVAYSTSILFFCGMLLIFFHKSKTE